MGRGRDLVWGRRERQRVAGVSVHVEIAGPPAPDPQRPTIAALHGFASGTFTWAGVAPRLRDSHVVVAWDRPPFGRSSRPPARRGAEDPYRLAADLERTVSVLEPHVGAAGVVLVGHSAGALVAVQLAIAGVVPVRGLVLIAPALAGEPPALVRRLAGLPGTRTMAVPALRVAVLATAPALRSISTHRSALTDATAAETARMLRQPGTAEALWHLTSTWLPPEAMDLSALRHIPAMVIGGEDDRISTPAPTRATADRLGADLHLLSGVGHAPHEQRPEVVAGLIGAFVEGIGR